MNKKSKSIRTILTSVGIFIAGMLAIVYLALSIIPNNISNKGTMFNISGMTGEGIVTSTNGDMIFKIRVTKEIVGNWILPPTPEGLKRVEYIGLINGKIKDPIEKVNCDWRIHFSSQGIQADKVCKGSKWEVKVTPSNITPIITPIDYEAPAPWLALAGCCTFIGSIFFTCTMLAVGGAIKDVVWPYGVSIIAGMVATAIITVYAWSWLAWVVAISGGIVFAVYYLIIYLDDWLLGNKQVEEYFDNCHQILAILFLSTSLVPLVANMVIAGATSGETAMRYIMLMAGVIPIAMFFGGIFRSVQKNVKKRRSKAFLVKENKRKNA